MIYYVVDPVTVALFLLDGCRQLMILCVIALRQNNSVGALILLIREVHCNNCPIFMFVAESGRRDARSVFSAV